MTVAFVTLGCKVNQVDSSALRLRLEAAGFACVEPEASPDVLVINSCAVTAESERKTRQKLRHFRTLYRNCVLVLTGCAAQVGKAEDYPEANLVMGHRDMDALAREIIMLSPTKASTTSFNESADRTRAHIKIEDGCDWFCAYCIIPHARGRVRSKPLEELRCELLALDAQGFREVVLVGINLAAYGSDLGCGLGDALELFSSPEIKENFTSIRRVRLGSLEPDLLTEELISKLEKFSFVSNVELCPHFHISLQSGCDSVLKRMGRHYSAEEYFTLVKRLRAGFPGAAITTDVLVGFPGESEAEFEASLAFVREIGFAKIHVFPYSSRPGTAAAAMPRQIPRGVKQARAKKMQALAQESRVIFLNSQIGSTLKVLPEEPHPLGGMQGYSANYTPVRIEDAGPAHQNQIVPVQITRAEGDYCVGVLSR